MVMGMIRIVGMAVTLVVVMVMVMVVMVTMAVSFMMGFAGLRLARLCDFYRV